MALETEVPHPCFKSLTGSGVVEYLKISFLRRAHENLGNIIIIIIIVIIVIIIII